MAVRRILRGLAARIGPLLFGRVGYARRIGVTVGEDCRLYVSRFGTEPFLVTIGDRVTIAPGVWLLTHDGSSAHVGDGPGTRYQRFAPIVINDDVFIGVNAIILPGVTIGPRVVVGAGAVVTGDVPPDVVVVGNPARIVKSFEAFETRVRALGHLDDGRHAGLSGEARVRALTGERR